MLPILQLCVNIFFLACLSSSLIWFARLARAPYSNCFMFHMFELMSCYADITVTLFTLFRPTEVWRRWVFSSFSAWSEQNHLPKDLFFSWMCTELGNMCLINRPCAGRTDFLNWLQCTIRCFTSALCINFWSWPCMTEPIKVSSLSASVCDLSVLFREKF